MDAAGPQLVSLEVQDDDSTTIVLRVNDRWICAEASPSDLGNTTVRQQYDRLVQGYRRQTETQETPPVRDSGDGSGEEAADCDDGTALQHWMMAVLSSTCATIAAEKPSKKTSLAAWYLAPIHFYNITAAHDSSHLRVESRDDLDEADYIHAYLLPHIPTPADIQALDVPWYAPEDVVVEAVNKAPIHPTLLSVRPNESGERSDAHEPARYFFQLATHGDARAVAREIRLLEALRQKGLYQKGIRAPRLAGCVPMPQPFRTTNTKSELLGILLTVVPALPLTVYMDPSVEEKRAADAAAARTMVDVLHAHGLVGGDAQADHVLVRHNQPWMIDIGGHDTPGWIDAARAETLKGDDMGTAKITRGLEHPEDNVPAEVVDDASDGDDHEAGDDTASSTKRKRDRPDDEERASEDTKEKSRRPRRSRS